MKLAKTNSNEQNHVILGDYSVLYRQINENHRSDIAYIFLNV